MTSFRICAISESQEWWLTPLIPPFGRPRQVDLWEFQGCEETLSQKHKRLFKFVEPAFGSRGEVQLTALTRELIINPPADIGVAMYKLLA